MRYAGENMEVVVTDPGPWGEKRDIPLARLENLLCRCDEPSSPGTLELKMDVEKHPFNGALKGAGTIGSVFYQSDATHMPPVLREGQVVALGRGVLSHHRFPVMKLDLKLGDEVRVLDAQGLPASAACVFSAYAKGRSGFDVSCLACGSKLEVSRAGVDPYPMQLNLWAYIKADPVLQALFALIGAVMFFLFQLLLGKVWK